MKNTGIVRRIDDLGRIVIPKEIRKNLRIKDGESLEIFLSGDSVVLKKYSPLDSLSEVYNNYVQSIYSETGSDVLIVDRDKVVAFAGNSKYKYLDKTISVYLERVIQNRGVVISKKKSRVSIIDGAYIISNYVISPIITGSDVFGAIIVLSSGDKMDDFIVKSAVIASKFLGKCVG